MTSSTRATASFLILLFILLSGVQLLFYRDSFAAKPSNDDFIALHQVDRGEEEGVGSFFRRSDVGDYRPLQNATFWAFGRWSRPHRLVLLRILHFAGFAFYAAVAFLWIRTLGLGRLEASVAACVVFFHPTLAGALAGFDNYSRFVVSAWVWLGTWIAYRLGGRPLYAVPLVSVCFAIGLGYMEYAVALIPLAVLATAWRGGKRGLYGAGLTFVCLAGILIAYVLVRVSGTATTTLGTGFLSLDPLAWARNTLMILVAVLFFGNTVPIMLEGSLAWHAWLVLNVTLVALTVGFGLWNGHRVSCFPAGEVAGAIPPGVAPQPRGLQFLVLAWAVTFFPMLLMKHISEIYLTSVILGLGLLIGLSARWWSGTSRPLRNFALFFAASQILLAASAIQAKVAGINGVGERADAMMRDLLEHLPETSEPMRIAMVFLEREAAAGKGYSVFAMPDDQLILPGYGTFAMSWYRPDRVLRLDQLVVRDPSDVDVGSYDLVLLWEGPTRRFTPIAPQAGGP